MILKTRRALTLALVTLAGAAAPASADPVVAGPATPDELAVLAMGGSLATPNSTRTDAFALHRVATTNGAYRGRITFPTDTLSKAGQSPNVTLRFGALRRSTDGRYVTFTAARTAVDTNFGDTNFPTAVRVAADGTWSDQPLGTGYMDTIGQSAVGAVTVDGARTWIGTNVAARPLATIATGETTMLQVAGNGNNTPSSMDLVDGSLVTTGQNGVSRLPGALPTAQNTTTPSQLFIPLVGAFDSVFVDTDGAAGADTAYVTRGTRGLWKFALEGGEWKARGVLAGNFAYVTGRAVAGAVELYLTPGSNAKVLKLVDTAAIGGELTTTGPATLAYAPARTRYAGLAFTPGTGLPADATPYPATPPLMTAPTGIDTHLGAAQKASITVEVSDPNTSDVTLTVKSAHPAIQPDDKITVTGSGAARTITFDPIAAGSATITLTASANGESTTSNFVLRVSGPAPDATGHYFSGLVDISATVDLGGDYFLGMSDEVNTVHLFRKGVDGGPLASFNSGFPGGETDFEGAARFGNTIAWSGSHGNNRSGSARPERRYVAFTTVRGTGEGTEVEFRNEYTRLWQQWKDWDAANGHGLGANKLKFNTATVPGLLPNAPHGFNVEGLTIAPGSSTTAWFGMRAPTITGDDGIERALILPVTNFDKLTSNSVNAELGAPILLDLGGRSIRDIAKNAADQYLISAGTGDTDDSVKGWALYAWDGNPDHTPQMVKELPTDEARVGAWEGIAELPADLVAGSRVLLTADSGDTGIGKTYAQYVTLGEPMARPAVVEGVTAAAKPGALDVAFSAATNAARYFVEVKDPAGAHAPGSPKFVTGTSASFEGLTAGTEYTVSVRAENVAARSAKGVVAKATPTQGARVATTTSVEFVGTRLAGETHKLIATVSDPNATGTIQFFNGPALLQDISATEPAPGSGGSFQYRRTFPVVNGKAEINITNRVNFGPLTFQARYTTGNAENFLSSQSSTIPEFIDWNPRTEAFAITGVTGERKVGGRVAIHVKLTGYKPGELYPDSPLPVELQTRVNGAANPTPLVGENTPENPAAEYGYVQLNTDGEGTFTTTRLAAGSHRITALLPAFNYTYSDVQADHVPVQIAPAADPIPEAPVLKRPRVMMTAMYSPLTTGQTTLTARVSDPSLAGTVQFMNGYSTNVGTPVPVVNGIATSTFVNAATSAHYMARFEPAADRATTVSPVSVPVSILRSATPLEFPVRSASTTTLAVSGERVAGATQTATVTVVSQGTDPLAYRDINGYAEVFDGDRSLGFAPLLVGKAELQFSLGAGVHALRAKYIPGDSLRGKGSESAAQDVTVVVKTDVPAPVGGSVPATLALTLGAPASFEPFVPGVAKEYTAATTANVISTAGDAALTVSEPGHLTNGAFSLAQPLRVELATAAWTAPVSNANVGVTFKQAIGASDALRTGTYSKTLTFTLSTTSP